MNRLELMRLQAEVLYVHDDAGRITIMNEPIMQPAPRFFWGHTNKGHVLRFRNDLPDLLATEIAQMMNQDEKNDKLAKVIHILEKDKKMNSLWMGPAYVCLEIKPTQSNTVLVSEQNKHYLEAGFARLVSELTFREPCYMAIENDMAVSICFSARSTDRAAEAGVETIEGYRGKGYALSVVSSWCKAIHDSGRIPLYSTSWDNYASQAIAKRLDLYQYGTDVSIY